MKALIITYHGTLNYGAELQAIAMQKVFSRYFQEVRVLNYAPRYLTEPYKMLDWTRFRGFVGTVLNVPTNILKKGRFQRDHRQFLRITDTKIVSASHATTADADWIILGSDQIWNLQINGDGDPVFFGEIQHDGAKVMSFSASIGNDEVSRSEKEIYQKRLENVDYIAVREKQAKVILEDSGINRPIAVTMDPTFLVSVAEWRTMEKEVKVPSQYILVFALNKYEETYGAANKLSKQTGFPVIEILGSNIDFLNLPNHRMIPTAGPSEFLYLIDHAAYVVTDSFHGTAFSVIFRKNFCVIPHKTRSARMVELLQKLGLADRIVFGNVDSLPSNKIDWKEAEEKLSTEVERSEQYIRRCVNSEGKNNG